MLDRKNIKNLYALSPLQEGMLFHALKDPGSRAYFEQLEFGLAGSLDLSAFGAAWQEVVDRHDALRTLFAVKNVPQPLQVVLKHWPLALETKDLSHLSESDARSRIAAHRTADLEQGFDLTRAPPMRLAVFRLAPERHRVIWSFHHILIDGWSLAVMQREWEALYTARRNGVALRLAPAPPYASYIRWLGNRNQDQAAAYWTGLLAGVSEPTPVPQRLARRFATDAPTYDGGEYRHPLSEAAEAALGSLARGHGVTTSTVVQALWGMLLARLNGNCDAVFAATVSGRPAELPEAEQTVGLFINAIPVRVRFDDGLSFADLLQRQHQQAIAGREFHHAPLTDTLSSHPLRQSLIDHILVFENYPIEEEHQDDPLLPKVIAGDTELHEHTHYPFEVQFLPGTPSILRFRYDRGLFTDAAVGALGLRFEDLALSASAQPGVAAATIAHAGSLWTPPRQVAVAASFTADPIAAASNEWLRQLAVPRRVQLSPYNQCLRELADPDSLLNQADLGILLLRFADALRDMEGGSTERDRRLEERFRATVDALARRPSAAPLLVVLLPAADELGELETRWRDVLASLPKITVIDLSDLQARYRLDFLFDAQADRLGHIPYTEAGCVALGTEVARLVAARSRPPFKVIAVDCDNTLWSGVCAEAGATGVVVGPGHAALQRFLIERQEEGFLIALCSKNVEADVWAVFDRNSDMVLQRQHLAVAAINWQPKSVNLRTLAAELNLGIDSVIFLDDNPTECAEVMAHCPEALALALPPDMNRIDEWLSLVWAFDHPSVTTEDRERTKMMQAERSRQAALATDGAVASLEEFLRGIGLVVRIGPMQPHQLSRVAQLTQRTNQFNLSGQRRDEAAMARLAAEADLSVWAVEVEDRFGAYGLTGVIIARRDAETLVIDSFLLSCRVLGRRVEDALLCALARLARRQGCRRIVAHLVATDRNEPVRRFLQTPPWLEDETCCFVCEVDQVAGDVPGVTLDDGANFVPVAGIFAPPPVRPKMAADSLVPGSPHRAQPLPSAPTIENEAALRHGVEYLPLLAAAAGWPATTGPSSSRSGPPKRLGRLPVGETETRIAAVWREVLGVAEVDAETPFQELGGHSLHAVRAISRLERAFDREIGLGRLFELATISALARWLDQGGMPSKLETAIPPTPDATDYPLSHGQERIWLLCHLGAPANAYNQCAAYHLRGTLDSAALRAAAQTLLDRHEILRTVFPLGASGPRQEVLTRLVVDFNLEESPGADLATLGRAIAAAGRRTFDLGTGPLIRFALFRRADNDHVLAIFLHHIVGDGWSFGLILHELAAAYRGQTLGRESLRYRDYAVWSRSPAFEAELEHHRDYWRRRLAGLPEIARIPPDFSPLPIPSGHGAGLRRILAVDLPALESWLAVRNAGLFHFLIAAVATLIARLGGVETVRLGTPVAGRDRPELETMVGMCVNTLVLDGQVGAKQTFSTLLKTMQKTIVGALDHQTYPFDRLVADLDLARDPSRNPLFDVLVALQNAPREDAELPGITATDLPVSLGLAAFDLVFEFAVTDAGLACELSYATDVYHPETAALLLDRLATLMAAVRANPESSLDAVPVMSDAELARLAGFARGPIQTVTEDTIHGLFASQAARTPRALALLSANGSLDYEALDWRSNALARRLTQVHGVHPGDVVAVLLERTDAFAVALLAVLKAGGIYLPLDPIHPPPRWRQLLTDAQPRALVASSALVAALGDLSSLDLSWLNPASAERAKSPPAVAISPDAPAYLIYTSGSTGTPKGVLVSHRAFVNMIQSQIRDFDLAPTDRVLQLASCAFDASLSEFFMGWLSGAAVVLADRDTAQDSLKLAHLLKKDNVTLATFTPSYVRQLADEDLLSLHRVILAGEAVRGADTARLRRLGIVCYNAYGPTETAVCATLGRVEEDFPSAAPVPIGQPLANLTAEILDPRGRPSPIGVPGELVISGVGVALGYWRQPDLTAERFPPNGYDSYGHPRGRSYRTGDLARWLPNGVLEYLGRNDDQIKLRGQRVEPGEVAARIAALEGVRHAAVLCQNQQGEGELVAYVCADPGRETALRTALAEQMPAYLVPNRWIFLDRLPLTSSGKLDKNGLPRVDSAPLPGRVPPANATEAALLAIWGKLLGSDPGVETNFFAAGGNSLKAMGAARLITERLGLPCQAIQFFRTPTVRALAAALAGSESACTPNATLHRLSPPARHTLIALPPAPGLGQVYAPLAPRLPGWSLRAFDFIDLPAEELVRHYARAVLELDFPVPPALLGYSGGGRLALALAAALTAQHRPPSQVILVDCWHWSTAAPNAIDNLEDPFADAPGGIGELATTYRKRLGNWEPHLPVTVPVHHLLAETDNRPPPPGFSRDWRAVCVARYAEYPASGMHFDFLDNRNLPANAALLHAVLVEATVTSSTTVAVTPVPSLEG